MLENKTNEELETIIARHEATVKALTACGSLDCRQMRVAQANLPHLRAERYKRVKAGTLSL